MSGEVVASAERPHAEASLRLLDAGVLVTSPFADGRGSAEASGRYGYPGPLLSLFAPDVGLAYWDYQTRVRWRTSEHSDADQIGAFLFGSYDSLSARNGTTGVMENVLGIEFHRADLRWDHRTSATGALRVALTLGYERSTAGDAGRRAGITFSSRTRPSG